MNSFPFDSMVTYQEDGTPVYDRAVNSEILSGYLSMLFGDGVMPTPSTCLQVTASSTANQVIVMPGDCNVQGKLAHEENSRTMILQAPHYSYDRIDSIVVRKNENSDYRNVDLYVLTGGADVNPKPPALTRNSAVYELRLANIFRPKNTSTVTQARITDTRIDTEQCGIVVANPNGIDTTTIFNQYQSALDEYLTLVASALDETLAGNLQNQIAALRKQTSLYGECSTAAATAAKTVSIPDFSLAVGAKATIKFVNGNTATGPTLNISSTGAKSLRYKGAAVPAGYITQNATIEVAYDGTYYNIVGDLTQSQVDNLQGVAGLKIQYGVTTITTSTTATATTVNFPESYNERPAVVVTLNAGTYWMERIKINASEVLTGSFAINHLATASGTTLPVMWIAIGK